MPTERIHKIIARFGYASRRKAEDFIRNGRVTLNGRVVTQLGTSADPDRDVICLDGARIQPPAGHLTVVLNKPKGVVSTMHDPQGRKTVRDLVSEIPRRLFPIGRLDADSEGLILLTDDGDLALKVMHPRYGVHKTYEALVEGLEKGAQLQKLEKGVVLSDGPTGPAEIKLLRKSGKYNWIRIRISEGRNRQIRRMCAKVGLNVVRLKRVALGGLWLDDLPGGAFREIKYTELRKVFARPGESPRRSSGKPGTSKTRREA
jgi:23S rRNA pseudouridine2605 synthase